MTRPRSPSAGSSLRRRSRVGAVAGPGRLVGVAVAAAFLHGSARAQAPEAVDGRTAVLWVGVHREAGTAWDIAADGASGMCTVEVTRLRCPASGPVTFRWGPEVGSDWRLFALEHGVFTEGVVVVAPGQARSAVVLASGASRAAAAARLSPDVVTPADVRDLFVRTGDHPVQPPSPAGLEALFALADHPDPLVRRELPDALTPWFRHTSLDPLPMGSPPVVPPGLIGRLSTDPDPAVRRRLAGRLRDVRDGDPMSEEAVAALLRLVGTGGAAQRVALSSLASRSKEGIAPALETWRLARLRMHDAGPPGRAAIKTLIALADVLEPGGEVDPIEAVHECLTIHPDRTWALWSAWRHDVPFDAAWVVQLFRTTVGWSPGLLTYWARRDAEALEAAFLAFEPGPPHTQRYEDLLAGLALLPDPRWSRLRGDRLSAPVAPPDPQ